MCFAFQTTSPRTPPNLMPPDLMPLQDRIRREAAKKIESRITKTTIFGLPDGFFPHHGCSGIGSVTSRNTQIDFTIACCEQIVALSHLHHFLWENHFVFVAKKIDWCTPCQNQGFGKSCSEPAKTAGKHTLSTPEPPQVLRTAAGDSRMAKPAPSVRYR